MTSSPHVVVTQVVTTRPPQLLQSVLVGRAGLLLPHPNQHPRQGRKAFRQPQQERPRPLGRGCSQQAKNESGTSGILVPTTIRATLPDGGNKGGWIREGGHRDQGISLSDLS